MEATRRGGRRPKPAKVAAKRKEREHGKGGSKEKKRKRTYVNVAFKQLLKYYHPQDQFKSGKNMFLIAYCAN